MSVAGVDPCNVATSALRAYLLANLSAKVTALNLLRAAVIQTPAAGPFTIPSGAKLRLGLGKDDTGTTVTLTSGSRTAAQVAADIDGAVPGIGAAADTLGRLVLTATQTPTSGTPTTSVASTLSVLLDNAGAAEAATGSNAALGWEEGGETAYVPALVAPTNRGVSDGWPVTVPDISQGFWIIFADRSAVPTGGSSTRRDCWDVTVQTFVLRPLGGDVPHRNREAISSCLRAVAEVLLSSEGRGLGRQAVGDVVYLEIQDFTVKGAPLDWTAESPGALHDAASMTIRIRVFQRPDNS